MAVILIPTQVDAAHWSQRSRLDGRDYILHFSYNQRIDRYFMSIHDDEDTPLLQGLRLLTNWPLLTRYKWNTALPPGELSAWTLQSDTAPPGFGELGEGRRCEMTYFDASEITT